MNLRFSAWLLWLLLAFGGSLSTAGASTDFVDLQKFIPGIVLDIRYATTNNFTKKQIYDAPRAMLRRAAAEKLKLVQADLQKQGMGLKIYDAYRPLSAQRKLWAIVPDERYVANPAKGSKHNRGAAVDLTIVAKDGQELEMPTPYDDFTEKAHWNYNRLSEQVLKNKRLLREVMERHGFAGISTEWWHFDDREWQKYQIMDLSFTEIDAGNYSRPER